MPQLDRAPACPQRDRSRIGLVALLLFGIAFGTSAQAADSLRPNVLLIYTDDQGYGDASCLNSESKVITPHLDRLAREGMVFTDAHCSDTVCTPSRYGLLTGRYSWHADPAGTSVSDHSPRCTGPFRDPFGPLETRDATPQGEL